MNKFVSNLDELDRVLSANGDLDPVIKTLVRTTRQLDGREKTELLDALNLRIAAFPLARVGQLALFAGYLVEMGADAHRFPSAVFDHLLAQLATIESQDDEAEFHEAYYLAERAAMACLSRSPALRRRLPQKPAILGKLIRYQDRYGFLGKMVQVLDDEDLIVIHLPTMRGFHCKLTGIADNFQLHILLVAAMAQLGIDGPAPLDSVIAAAGNGTSINDEIATSGWQLMNWSALRGASDHGSTGSVKSWIWNEGVPADIQCFEGTRVVLIEPSSIQRSWNAQRTFPHMPGALKELRLMSDGDVESLVAAMRSDTGAT